MSQSKFQRDKFKDTTSASQLKGVDKAVESVTRSGNKSYAGFLDIEVGLNTFLIYPSHETILGIMPGGEDVKSKPFIVPKQTWWLKKEVEDKDKNGNVKKDAKGRAIMKVVPSPVFDARIHSSVKKDVVDLYMKKYESNLKAQYGESKDAEKIIKDKMEIFTGNYNKNVKGIVGKPFWVMYAQKILAGDQRVFGRLEVGKAVKMRINDLIALEESKSPIGTQNNNPFTDIEYRRSLHITFDDKADKPQDYYKTELDTTIDRTKGGVVLTYPFTDDDLEEFLKYPPLSKQYEDCYTKRDFDLAIQGLRIFDDEHELGLFSDEEFVEEISQMRDLFRDPEVEAEETTDETDEEAEEEVDVFQRMDRNELKSWARQNKTGIAIIATMSDDDIRSQLREWQDSQSERSEGGNEQRVSENETSGSDDLQKVFDEKDNRKSEQSEKPLSAADRARLAREKAASKKA